MSDVRLMLGDCLEAMGAIPDGSVDLVLCDLPYGTTALAWDVVIPFEQLWTHYRRLLKPRGAVVLMSSQPFTTDVIQSNRPWFKYCCVWEKSNGTNFLNAKYQPLKIHEDIVVFSRAASSYSPQGSMTYNPQMGVGKTYAPGGRRAGNYQFHSELAHKQTPNEGTRYPRSVVRIASVNEAQMERTGHPSQKPSPLFEYLVRTYSNEGDTVLDSCMGSGTTGVACVNTGRHFIGIEKDATYFAVAERRISAARADVASRLNLA